MACNIMSCKHAKSPTKKLLRKGKGMSRKLKFRVWNEDENKFMPSGLIGISDGKFIDLKNGSVHFDNDDKIIEQFTGLVDKNGKEIFEGDVLKLAGFGGVFRVRYVKAHAMFIAEQIENDYSDARAVPFSDLARDEMVIIGNIHENGDLLK